MFSTTGRRQYLSHTEHVEWDLGRNSFQTKADFVSGPRESLLFNTQLTSIARPTLCLAYGRLSTMCGFIYLLLVPLGSPGPGGQEF